MQPYKYFSLCQGPSTSSYLCSVMQFKHRLRGMVSTEHMLGNTYSLGVQVIM